MKSERIAPPGPERAILVGIHPPLLSVDTVKEHLEELAFLASTAGAEVQATFIQRMEKPDGRTFIGSGKVLQIKAYAEEHHTDLVVFDDELSPSQQRNLERELGLRVLDRTTLILDIFAARAQTAHAKTQVELAQYQYLLPRLARMWSHLDRIKGGIGMKGAGEKEIETDRRLVREKIALLKTRLADIDRQMATQRKHRGAMVRVALVGYTNVGKSTLMNILSKATVLAENKLFATLDTTVRKVVLGQIPILLSDTVGFIRKLPTQLVESFKSTLDEVREADVLVHVVDLSNPAFEDHIRVVNQTLKELGASDKPTLLLFNKIDAYVPEPRNPDDLEEMEAPRQRTLEELKQTWMNTLSAPVCFVSAARGLNLDGLRQDLYQLVRRVHVKRYPHTHLPPEDQPTPFL